MRDVDRLRQHEAAEDLHPGEGREESTVCTFCGPDL